MRSIFFALLAIVLSNVTVSSQNKVMRPQPGEIKSITLDQRELIHDCPPGTGDCSGPPPTSFLVNVRLEVLQPSKKSKYQYSVSAGNIIGQGTNVVWDLTNTPPGSYIIRAEAIKNGKSLGIPRSETLYILSGICICDCTCPYINIAPSRRSIVPGDSVSILADVTGGAQDRGLTLNWTASIGQIVSGQGTSAILVRVPQTTKATHLTVTLDIGVFSGPCSVCPHSTSETIEIKHTNARE